MFLAEFYAMYLMAWSDVLWPKSEQIESQPAEDGKRPPAYTLPTLNESCKKDDWEMSSSANLDGLDTNRCAFVRFSTVEKEYPAHLKATLEFSHYCVTCRFTCK